MALEIFLRMYQFECFTEFDDFAAFFGTRSNVNILRRCVKSVLKFFSNEYSCSIVMIPLSSS